MWSPSQPHSIESTLSLGFPFGSSISSKRKCRITPTVVTGQSFSAETEKFYGILINNNIDELNKYNYLDKERRIGREGRAEERRTEVRRLGWSERSSNRGRGWVVVVVSTAPHCGALSPPAPPPFLSTRWHPSAPTAFTPSSSAPGPSLVSSHT